MRLINVTNSHSTLVNNQLQNTDSTLVEVYSAGNTDVIFSQSQNRYEIVISNNYRPIREKEIDSIREFFLKRKIDKNNILKEKAQTSHTANLIVISIPIKS